MTERRAAFGLIFVGIGLVLLAASRTWATVVVHELPGVSQLSLSGGRAVPSAVPIALAAAAGALVLATAGLAVRMLVALALALAGGWLALTSAQVGRDRAAAGAKAVEDALGLLVRRSSGGLFYGSSDASTVHFSLWPWVGAAGGALIAVAGILLLARSRSWPRPGRRFEREASAARDQTDRADPIGADPIGTWDALSRGEDPTSTEDPTSRSERST